MPDAMSDMANDEFSLMEALIWASPQTRLASGRYPNLSPSSLRNFQQSPSGLLLPKSPSPPRTDWVFASGQLYQSYALPSFSLFGSVPVKKEHQPPLPVEHRQMPVIGYRAWDAVQSRRLGCEPEWALQSRGIAFNWRPGVNRATHHGNESMHVAPDERCVCGLYVLADLDAVEEHLGEISRRHVVGAVMGWGRVIQHGTEGWRAQYARPLAFLDLWMGSKNRAMTEVLAARYGVPVMSRAALELMVREYGDPLPEKEP